jgi:hypothetical protein
MASSYPFSNSISSLTGVVSLSFRVLADGFRQDIRIRHWSGDPDAPIQVTCVPGVKVHLGLTRLLFPADREPTDP